jgi:serine phosphatase RsbU (regulator of sigma subunit)
LEIGDKRGIAESYNNLGQIYYNISKDNLLSTTKTDTLVEKSLYYLNNSLRIYEEIGDKSGTSYVLVSLGQVCKIKGDFQKMQIYAERAYKISKELGFPDNITRAVGLLKEYAIIRKDYKQAFNYLNEEISFRDSIENEENYKQLQKQQARYEYEKKAAIDSVDYANKIMVKDIEIEKVNQEKKARAMQRNFLTVGLSLVLLLMFFIFRSYRQKKKANVILETKNQEILYKNIQISEKNEELHQLIEEVTTQKEEIEIQKEKIEIIHSDLAKSIDYAERIQRAILPDGSVMSANFSEYFVFFKPRDIVSGDFFWSTHLEGITIVASADCTGHGVPGAFMSMLGISFLREIVQKEYVTHPGVILRKLRKEIIRSMKQKGEVGEQKDGMDMALISVEHETGICMYAGANNPMYLIRNGVLTEYKPDKMPIAIYEKMDNYTVHEIQIQPVDQLYLFSDGFPDQFGGPNGKKYLYKQFKDLLLKISSMSMYEQKTILESEFAKWKGNHEQVDDVVVVGLKI